MTAAVRPPRGDHAADNGVACLISEDLDGIQDTVLKVDRTSPAERRRLKHSAKMAQFRKLKKQTTLLSKQEHRQLEKEMKLYVAIVREQAASCERIQDDLLKNALRKAVVECEALRSQNMALRDRIKQHQTYAKVLQEKSGYITETEELILPTLDKPLGRWFQFSHGEPPFYFHEFSHEDVMKIPNPLKPNCAIRLSFVEEFLGWNVHRARVSPYLTKQSVLPSSQALTVRFSKCIQCSIDSVYEASWARRNELRPLLQMPMDWGRIQQSRSSTEVLQTFDKNACLMVYNIVGATHLRYMYLARCSQWKLPDGKRKIGFSMVIVDSEANKRSREAELEQDNVEWVTEGGASLILSEVDETTTDIVYEHWGNCQSDLHADYLMVQWTEFAVRFEQEIIPSNVLRR